MSKPKRISSGNSQRGGAAFLLWSMPGVGKTSLITSDPDIKTLVIRPPTDHVDSAIELGHEANFDETVISHWKDWNDPSDGIFRWIQQGGYKDYDWFWLDSLSLWQDIGLGDLFDIAVQRNSNRRDFGLDKQEYGINQFRINTLVKDMVGLAADGKLNFGITCHTMEWYNPHVEEMMWAPNIQGREGLFMQKICGMMKTVAYYYLAKPEGKTPYRVLQTKTNKNDIFVKDQMNVAPKGKLKNPTMADIHKATISRTKTETKTRRPARRRSTRRSK